MSLLKSALTVSGLTLVSRVTGVIRDMLIARFFGASAETDAFYVAFRLPNMLRRLFAEGAFQQAFVPMLADVKERSEGEAGTFIDHVFTVLALSVFAASILGVVAAPLLVWAIASGLASAPEAFDLASVLTRFMFPYIAFMALTALAGPVSNFVLALLALLCARLVYHQYGALWVFIFDLLLTTAYLSVGLGLFNLIPISPLDGSKVLFAFLPDSAYEKLMRYEKYGMIALLILVWLGVGDNVLSTAIYNVYAAMINFVFRGIV